MIHSKNLCPICKIPLKNFENISSISDYYSVECFRCGKYRIEDVLFSDLLSSQLNKLYICNLSAWLYHNQVSELNQENIKKIVTLPQISVDEKAQKVLLFLAKSFPIPGQKIPDIISELKFLNESLKNPDFGSLKNTRLLEILSQSWLTDLFELSYILNNYLEDAKYLNYNGYFIISPLGWQYINQIKMKIIDSNKIFIAMRFKDDLLKFADEYIESAIYLAGYEPIRIDKHIHSNIIDDEIIASIRKSKLIVSDFTDNSSGVYFETGFARGLNLPVIYLCEKQKFEDEKHKPHFDVNHYPFLLWERDKGDKIKKELQLRIEALVGRGLNNND